MAKRPVDLVVISDVHLGTYGCHAKELLQYLKSIDPRMVVLNGDIVDVWQFSKRYFPPAHMQVVKHIVGLAAKEIPVYYIPGNHDEMLRRFKDFSLGSLRIVNKLSLKLDGQSVWMFHGDAFDVVMQHSKWLAKLGAVGYDVLILINRAANWVSQRCGGGKMSLSKRVKAGVKSAVKFINHFEDTVCDIAASNGYQYVVCGHIHQPEMRTAQTAHGPVQYLNSGDWIENLTALEYMEGRWSMYRYANDPVAQAVKVKTGKEESRRETEIQQLLDELRSGRDGAEIPVIKSAA